MCPPDAPPDCGGKGRGEGGSTGRPSHDPNLVIGPNGFGPLHAILETQALGYYVEFENKPPEAEAPAQEVFVTLQFDSDLDWTTFELGEVGFGSTVVAFPLGRQSYETTVDTKNQDGTPLKVKVSGSLNLATGLVTWVFRSIDPATGELPEGVFDGFLPVNDETNRGVGFVNFHVQPKKGLATGTTIVEQASIVFDTNAPVVTDPFTNVIDNGFPTSAVQSLPATTTTTTFNVTWVGTDSAAQAGIASYDVYVSDNNNAYTLWKDDTSLNSDSYAGTDGHTYRFYSIATDNLGFVEQKLPAAEATTSVVVAKATTTSVTSSLPGGSAAGQSVTFTANVSAALGTPTGSVQFQVDNTNVGSPVALDNGQATFSTSALTAGQHTIKAIYTSNSAGFVGSQGTVGQNVVGPTVGADVQLTSSGSPSTALAGKDSVTYKFIVKNIGTLDATGVKVDLASVLPSGVTVKSVSAPKGTSFIGSNGNGTWTIASLKKKASQTLTVTLTVGASAARGTNVISSTATAFFANQGLINTSNDVTTQRTSVSTAADLSISKHLAPKSVQAGGNALYTVTVTNSGLSTATGVSFVDTLPAGTTFIKQTQTSGPSFVLGNTATQVTNTIASLPAGSSATFAILVHVDGELPKGQSFSNRATVTSTVADPKTSNNTSIASTSISDSAASLNANLLDPTKADLVITGSSKADTIVVEPASGGRLAASLNGKSLGTFSPTGNIVIYSRADNDTVTISPLVSRTALVFGGLGNDQVTAGGGNSSLSGGAGADNLVAGAGRSILIGGPGTNTLNGSQGSNVLVGGSSSHDAQQTALEKLLAEWSRTDANYTTRVQHLRGTLVGGLNDPYVLNETTVSDNESIDQLLAGLGDDWFLADTVGGDADQITTLQVGEEIFAI